MVDRQGRDDVTDYKYSCMIIDFQYKYPGRLQRDADFSVQEQTLEGDQPCLIA